MKLEIVSRWAPRAAESVRCAQLAPSGEWLARADQATIVLQQAVTGREMARLSAGQAQVLCLAVAPDSSWMVAGSDQEDEPFTLRVYSRQEQWALASEFEAHASTTAVAIADGQVFASAGEGVVTVWSLEEGDLWSSEAGSPIAALAFSDDGSQLAVARADQVEVWGRDGTPLWRVSAPGCTVLGFLGESVLASGATGLYRLAAGKVEEHAGQKFLAAEPRERFASDVWFGPGISHAGELRLRFGHGLELWRGNERLWRTGALEEILVGQGRVLLSGGDRLFLGDLEGNEIASHASEGGLGKLSLSASGQLAGWVTNTELVVLSLASGEVLGRAPGRNFAALVDDRLVFGKLLVYPEWRLECEGPVEERTDLVAPKLVLAPGGQAACLAVPQGGLRRARFEDGETEQTYFWTAMPDRQVCLDGWLVAWTSEAIARWRLDSGALRDVTPCDSRGLNGIAVSPSGERALAIGEAIHLLELSSQSELARAFVDDPVVVGAVDEDTFLVGSSSGEVQVLRAFSRK